MDHPFRGQGPLLSLLLPYVGGVFLGVAAGRAWPAVAALLLMLCVPLVAFRLRPAAAAWALMALCGVLAAARVPTADPDAVRPLLGGEVVLRAHVEEGRLVDGGFGGFAGDAALGALDGSAAVRLARVRFFVRNQDDAVPVPSEIRAVGRLSAIRSLGNPGEFPRELGASARNVQYAFSTDASRAVWLPGDGGAPGVLARLRARTRDWLLRCAGRGDGALYLLSLTTGDVPPASHPLAILLRRTGLAHLLAISGVNVSVFFVVHAFLVRCALWAFRRRHGSPDLNRASALLSLPAAWGYVLLAGAPVPALRAAGMLTVGVFLWQALGVRGAGAAWSALFFLALAVDPFLLASPSFLLSYGAAFFLVVSCGGGIGSEETGAGARAWRLVRRAIAASTVAFLGTLPMSAAFFGAVPLLAIPWNFLFGPLLGIGGVVGAFAAAVGGVFSLDILAVPVALAARGLTAALALLERLSGSGWGYLPVPPAGAVAPAAATILAAAGAVALRRGGRPPWVAVAAVAAAFLAWLHLPYIALPGDRLEVVALNVGKGAAHVVFFPGGRRMVVDCGSALNGDAGERIVAPFLRGRGVRRVDVLALTHALEDHFGGAQALLDAFEVGEIWIPEGVPPESFGPAVAARAGIVRPKSAGERYGGAGAEAVVRAPPRGTTRRGEANAGCLALEVRDAALSVWLPGDVETGPSSWAPADPGDRRSRVLFLPHHGSPGADPRGWLRAARPVAAISQNWNCYENENLLPSSRYFRLENGAVVVCSGGGGVSLRQPGWPRILRFFRRLAVPGPAEVP